MPLRQRFDGKPYTVVFAITLLLLCVGIWQGCDTNTEEEDSPLVLHNVTLIDGTGVAPQAASVVIVLNGRITQIGAVKDVAVPEGATVLDMTGHWVLPGFIDMHTHMPGQRGQQEEVLRTLLGFGITTARTPAAGTPAAGVELRDRLARGEVLGPRLFAAGWLINSRGSGFGIEVGTEAEIRAVVRSQVQDGVDFIKLYVGLTPDLVAAAIDEAHGLGVPVIGHLGRTTWQEAADLGIDFLTHSAIWGMAHSLVPADQRATFRNFFTPNAAFDPDLFSQWQAVVDLDGPAAQTLIQSLLDNNVVLDPNLVLAEAVLWGDDPQVLARLEPTFAPDAQAATWSVPHPYSAFWSLAQYDEAQQTFPLFLEAIRVFHERGVRLTVGTDLENPRMTPGVSFHRELELLVAAGIPPLEVLRIATHNGAEALGILDEVGTLEVGKLADLLVLTADPMQDIGNTRALELVLLKGKRFASADLLPE